MVAEAAPEEKLERPMGLEPTPTAWQAVVLPLYYGRLDVRLFYSTALLAAASGLWRRPATRGKDRQLSCAMRVDFTTGDRFWRSAKLSAFFRSV